MKLSNWIASMLGVVLLGALGCSQGNTVSGPGQGSAQKPAEVDLSGAWTGTVSSLSGGCSPESFSVSLTQTARSEELNGSQFTGSFATPCGGTFEVHGLVNGGHLYGSVTGKGRITGTATETQIEITTVMGSGGTDNGQAPVDRFSMHR